MRLYKAEEDGHTQHTPSLTFFSTSIVGAAAWGAIIYGNSYRPYVIHRYNVPDNLQAVWNDDTELFRMENDRMKDDGYFSGYWSGGKGIDKSIRLGDIRSLPAGGQVVVYTGHLSANDYKSWVEEMVALYQPDEDVFYSSSHHTEQYYAMSKIVGEFFALMDEMSRANKLYTNIYNVSTAHSYLRVFDYYQDKSSELFEQAKTMSENSLFGLSAETAHIAATFLHHIRDTQEWAESIMDILKKEDEDLDDEEKIENFHDRMDIKNESEKRHKRLIELGDAVADMWSDDVQMIAEETGIKSII